MCHGEADLGELLVGDLDAFGVVALVEMGVDLQPWVVTHRYFDPNTPNPPLI